MSTIDFIFDRIDAVEEKWNDSTPAKYLILDVYTYLELKEALGYDMEAPEITHYHGYKIMVDPDAESGIELR